MAVRQRPRLVDPGRELTALLIGSLALVERHARRLITKGSFLATGKLTAGPNIAGCSALFFYP